MTNKISTGKKKGAQKYQNVVAYKHNPASKVTKKILALPNTHLCPKCHEIIEWRKRYRKYKPITVPKKCVWCSQKAVREAYHVICKKCSEEKNACAKCLEVVDGKINDEKTQQDILKEEQEFENKIQRLKERERRTVLRKLEKGEIDKNEIPEPKNPKDDFDDFDDFSDDFSDEESEENEEDKEE